MQNFPALLALLVLSTTAQANTPSESLALFDQARQRSIPVELYQPSADSACNKRQTCPVAFISPGYGLPHTAYSFIAGALTRRGYLAIAIGHDLESDPPLAKQGDLVTIRTPMWRRGVANLAFVRAQLSRRYPSYDWTRLTLIGHSNGGDISSLMLQERPSFAGRLITLDHRRVALPRHPAVRVLSIRASDYQADAGVLPSKQESAHGIRVVTIAGARHDDMHDDGPAALKAAIAELIDGSLGGQDVSAATSP